MHSLAPPRAATSLLAAALQPQDDASTSSSSQNVAADLRAAAAAEVLYASTDIAATSADHRAFPRLTSWLSPDFRTPPAIEPWGPVAVVGLISSVFLISIIWSCVSCTLERCKKMFQKANDADAPERYSETSGGNPPQGASFGAEKPLRRKLSDIESSEYRKQKEKREHEYERARELEQLERQRASATAADVARIAMLRRMEGEGSVEQKMQDYAPELQGRSAISDYLESARKNPSTASLMLEHDHVDAPLDFSTSGRNHHRGGGQGGGAGGVRMVGEDDDDDSMSEASHASSAFSVPGATSQVNQLLDSDLSRWRNEAEREV